MKQEGPGEDATEPSSAADIPEAGGPPEREKAQTHQRFYHNYILRNEASSMLLRPFIEDLC